MKKVVIVVFIVAIIIVLLFLKGCGGFGAGRGLGSVFNSKSVEQSDEKSTTENAEKSSESQESNEVVVKIVEDKVTVNGKEISNSDELKTYLETINNDLKTYILEQDNAILSVYNWVTEVFDDLQITYQEEKKK